MFLNTTEADTHKHLELLIWSIKRDVAPVDSVMCTFEFHIYTKFQYSFSSLYHILHQKELHKLESSTVIVQARRTSTRNLLQYSNIQNGVGLFQKKKNDFHKNIERINFKIFRQSCFAPIQSGV